jgi:NADPH2:quinone reductase
MAMNSTIAVYATNGNPQSSDPMRELMEMHRVAPAGVVALPPPLLAQPQG